MNNETRLEDVLGCFGYYGFGSGYALAAWGPHHDTSTLYCNRCKKNDACWQRHRVRVQEFVPELCTVIDNLATEGFKGMNLITEFAKRTEQSPDHFVEPYLSIMTGNMEDGGSVAIGGRPKPRAPNTTLSWPLTPLK